MTSFSVGQVKGYLNSKESDYLDANGRPTALWRVEYVSGELKDDAEDLERHEVLQSAPKPSRPDLSMREVEAQSKARAREGGSSKGSKKKEREPALDYVPPRVEINRCVGYNAIEQASRRWRGGRRDDSAQAMKF